MKLIHTADIHLDSDLTAHFSKEQSKERRSEILLTFEKMVVYAEVNGVKAILVAGDLFDKKNIRVHTRDFVIDTIKEHPAIDFYYLVGNHDASAFFDFVPVLPENLHLFGEDWTTYTLSESAGKKITLTGADFKAGSAKSMSSSLDLSPYDFNIVTLHGQIAEYAQKDKGEIIDLAGYRNKQIDYLALGHIHSYKEGALPPRGTYCYPGCLEGRGFDECGRHGFVLLDVDESTHSFRHDFVPFSERDPVECKVDISGASTVDVIKRIENELSCSARATDMVRVVLTGELDVDSEIDLVTVRKHFEPAYYVFTISDDTKMKIDYSLYKRDVSLKGEFIRLVENDETLDEDSKARIIKFGIKALSGEEIAE